MLHKTADQKREQIEFASLDMLVPTDHLLRDIDKYIDFSFIYDLVEDKYSPDQGRPSLDPVMLLKIPLIQTLYGITSIRATTREIQVNAAYRWFLGLGLSDPVPHFSTFGKNYKRRFEGTDIFEQIFEEILKQCMEQGFVEPQTLFVDATHIKANANKKKVIRVTAQKRAKFYEEELKKEINEDRKDHGKESIKDKEDEDHPKGGSKQVNQSTTDPDSGMFHKGEHKKDLAYVTQTACDRYGWVLAYSIHPGNEHDSSTFPDLYNKLKRFDPKMLVMDAGYKTPSIAKLLLKEAIMPLFPYTRPKGKKGMLRKKEFVYDAYYDCYICPENHTLPYATTSKEGYREYKSRSYLCEKCPKLEECTKSKNKTKMVARHLWENYMEACEDIRHTRGMKEIYALRKETIERIFGTAKEYHGLRFTRLIGKTAMEMKVGLTFACMNMKKLVKMMKKQGGLGPFQPLLLWISLNCYMKKVRSTFAFC